MLAFVPPSPEVARYALVRKMATQSFESAAEDFGAQLSLIRDRLGPKGDELCEELFLHMVALVSATRRGGRPAS